MPRSSNSPPNNSHAALFVRRLREAIAERACLPVAGARSVTHIKGLAKNGVYVRLVENVLTDAKQVLLESGQVFRRGKDVVYVRGFGPSGSVIPLSIAGAPVRTAPAVLSNLFDFVFFKEEKKKK